MRTHDPFADLCFIIACFLLYAGAVLLCATAAAAFDSARRRFANRKSKTPGQGTPGLGRRP